MSASRVVIVGFVLPRLGRTPGIPGQELLPKPLSHDLTNPVTRRTPLQGRTRFSSDPSTYQVRTRLAGGALSERSRKLSRVKAGIEAGPTTMAQVRDVVFVSHANPEDNRFATWLSVQLVREGYKVWCDETKLLCGDDTWSEIETIIRSEAAKFIFVGSRSSNHKPGVLKELHLAAVVERSEKLEDFVLPIVIDDLPFSELNIEVTRLLAASFREGWPKGLAQILARLEKDNVPRTGPGPSGIASWWRHRNGALVGVRAVPQTCPTNWYLIRSLPETLVVAHPRSPNNKAKYLETAYQFPVVSLGEGIAALSPRLAPSLADYGTVSILGHGDENGISRAQINRTAVELLRTTWEQVCRARGLQEHPLSQRRRCFYFSLGQIPGDHVSFTDGAGKTRRRSVVGFKTVGEKKRWWHLAIEGRPLLKPFPVLALRLHILFSDEGKTIWQSDKMLHKARRSQGRTWWNDDWRDRGRGSMVWLAGGEDALSLPIGSNQVLRIDTTPMTIVSPVSYAEPDVEPPEEAAAVEALETDEDEGEDVA